MSIYISIFTSSDRNDRKKWFTNFSESKKFLFNLAGLQPRINEGTSKLDDILLPLLTSILGEGSFLQFDIDKLLEELKYIHIESNMLNVISIRWKALIFLCESKKNNCLELLEKAYSLSKNDANIPHWIEDDILIDIRDISRDLEKDAVDIRNNTQKRIEENTIDIYYPLLDRYDRYIDSKILDSFIKLETTSPHTVQLGDDTETVLENIFKIFLVAVFYGSIVHLKLVNVRLKKYLFFTNYKYANSGCFKSYLQASILSWDTSDKNALLNTFQERFTLLTNYHAKAIWESIENYPLSYDKIQKKLTAMTFIGDYMDDEIFILASRDCFSLLQECANDGKNPLLYISATIDLFKAQGDRLDINDIFKFILVHIDNLEWLVGIGVLESLYNANYKEITNENLNKFLDNLKGLKEDLAKLENFLINVRVRIDEERVCVIDNFIKEMDSKFLSGFYTLNTDDSNSSKLSDIINSQLAEAERRLSERAGSMVFGYNYEPMQFIYSALESKLNIVNVDDITKIALVIERIVFTKSQNILTINYALELLILLLSTFDDEVVLDVANKICDGKKIIKDFEDDFGFGVSRPSNVVPQVLIEILAAILNRDSAITISRHLASVTEISNREKINFSASLYRICKNTDLGKKFTPVTQNMLAYYLISNSYSDLSINRHFAIRSLTDVAIKIQYYATYVTDIFSSNYDKETDANKTHILEGMWKIDKANIVTTNILEKSKISSNYRVRRHAFRLLNQA